MGQIPNDVLADANDFIAELSTFLMESEDRYNRHVIFAGLTNMSCMVGHHMGIPHYGFKEISELCWMRCVQQANEKEASDDIK